MSSSSSDSSFSGGSKDVVDVSSVASSSRDMSSRVSGGVDERDVVVGDASPSAEFAIECRELGALCP